uniref:Large ribosomal subunit protein uL22c n=1 Tax=Phacus pleuronectes TaxID=102908 RepID=A0A3G3LLW4_9EUGL|nr:ribosomal protein L22 [Phacus pleuronectes]AYQ93697.1 ribosomal protein L22 [Phacus pleuronectes]
MKFKEVLQGKAIARYVRVSPLKVRRVLNQINGRSYSDSLIILKFMPYKVCPLILKVLKSAFFNVNISQNLNISESSFYVSEARVDEAPFLKRFCPHAQGRGFPIKKRMSHIISVI